MMMIDVDSKIKKKKGAEFFERDEDLDDEWVKQHQDAEVEELRQKISKKFEKDNEKLVAEGDKAMKPKELTERLEKANELAAKYKKENKTSKVEAEGKGPSVEKLETNIEKIVQRIENMKIQMEDKEGNKEVALGTSKIVSSPPVHSAQCIPANQSIELHRPPSHRRLLQEIRRPHREVLLQDAAREVRLGYQVR